MTRYFLASREPLELRVEIDKMVEKIVNREIELKFSSSKNETYANDKIIYELYKENGGITLLEITDINEN